jgi:hypothetical protein
MERTWPACSSTLGLHYCRQQMHSQQCVHLHYTGLLAETEQQSAVPVPETPIDKVTLLKDCSAPEADDQPEIGMSGDTASLFIISSRAICCTSNWASINVLRTCRTTGMKAISISLIVN